MRIPEGSWQVLHNGIQNVFICRVLGKPTVLPVPALAVKAAFGELGKEALLWGQRVVPAKAEKVGFRFFYEGVEESLRFQLGRNPS